MNKKHILTHFDLMHEMVKPDKNNNQNSVHLSSCLFQHLNVITATRFQATYLQVDGKNERGGSDDGKGLVV